MTPRKSHPRSVLPIGLALLALSMLGGCNTMRGVGKDTEAVGEKIQDEAEQHLDDKETGGESAGDSR